MQYEGVQAIQLKQQSQLIDLKQELQDARDACKLSESKYSDLENKHSSVLNDMKGHLLNESIHS